MVVYIDLSSVVGTGPARGIVLVKTNNVSGSSSSISAVGLILVALLV